MDAHRYTKDHRKRKRRRRGDKPAISASLVLDERLRGDVGVLSEDLCADLFLDDGQEGQLSDDTVPSRRPDVHYVAISPWLPISMASPQSVSWTILPVRLRDNSDSATRPHSSLQFPANSTALQSFFQSLKVIAPSKTAHRQDAPIEIRIYDVAPLPLDSIFVNADTDALRQLQEVHAKFGGGFGTRATDAESNRETPTPIDTRKASETSKGTLRTLKGQDWWENAIREAVTDVTVVHSGDLLSLPLPAHPITHVPASPIKVSYCEPVSQGIVLPSTRIVVVKSRGRVKPSYSTTSAAPHRTVNGIAQEDEDTSNEQFFSAAEDRFSIPGDQEETTLLLESETSGTETGDLSDDSEDMISLSATVLPTRFSSVFSQASVTPHPLAIQGHGIASPGSVHSAFTATTVRGISTRTRLFRALPLLRKISEELLYPKPDSMGDEEARIFVDTATLAKVGCFSGDWVKIEAVAGSQSSGLGSWGLADLSGDEAHETRVVRVYGLPPSMTSKSRKHTVPTYHDRRSSTIGLSGSVYEMPAYLSPILLANLHNPIYLRISAHASAAVGLPKTSFQKPKASRIMMPPLAKEVTLLKISTPLSTDRFLQPSLFAGLKEHFERRTRLVKVGDLVGISINEILGKTLYEDSPTEESASVQELLSDCRNWSESASYGNVRYSGVAWFKVGGIVTGGGGNENDEDLEQWCGVSYIDAASTKMVQAGSEQMKLPSTTINPWQYYLGVKQISQPVGPTLHRTGLPQMPSFHDSPFRKRLRELISASTSERAITFGLPPLAILLTSNQRHVGKAMMAVRACEDLGLHIFVIDGFEIVMEGGTGSADVKAEALLKARAERALTCGPNFTVLIIRHVENLSAERMVKALQEIQEDSRVIIATTTEVEKVPDGMRKLFTHELDMKAPDETERESILQAAVADSGASLAPDVDLSSVALKTAALVAGDLVDVVERAIMAKRERLEKLAASVPLDSSPIPVTLRDIEISGGAAALSLTNDDFTVAVSAARKTFADAIGAPKIPNVSWSDVGGLSHVKSAVMETIQLPLARPELFAKGMKKRSGILFYGPPGTGKTLLAKAIATEFSLNFFSVKGPELLNMYIGESEANVRRVFQRARDARPCVVFFDELDSVAPKRGNQGDSGGVMDRIVSQLLAELDGMSEGSGSAAEGGVFVIGATNRPDLLDQALLRPGRFDKMLYLGVADTHEKQLTILEALTRKFTLSPDLSLRRIASTLPFTYTGADLYALCSDAMLKAITRQSARVDQKVKEQNASRAASGEPPISIAYFFDHYATEEDTAVTVTEKDFLAAKRELVPSVSMQELMHYERVRREFEGVGKGVSDQVGKDKASTQELNGLNGTTTGHGYSANGTTPGIGDESSRKARQPRTLSYAKGKRKTRGKGKVIDSSYDGEVEDDQAEEETIEAMDGDNDRLSKDVHDQDDDDDVIRTEHLRDEYSTPPNGTPAPDTLMALAHGKGKVGSVAAFKGKGKGEARTTDDAADGEFGDLAEADDELYT